jgi:hypothetical protein
MNCAWCNPDENGSHGICDDCMRKFFGIEPKEIHDEIEQEEQQLEKEQPK